MLKHSESLTDKEKVKLDLYKILRMSVLLSQDEVDELTLSKFKSASLNLDKMNTESYEEELESMFYDTNTLEEEEIRLKKLVEFIKNRLEQRRSLEADYKNVTNNILDDLEYIEKSGELDLYERRLDLIRSYLDNFKTIDVNKKELKYLEEQLASEFDLRESNEEKNINFEDKLYTDYVNILYEEELEYFTKLSDISDELHKISKEILEAKEQKDTFVTAFDNLKSSGISGDLELEYASYVENAKRNYYFVKEKEILLKLYELINKKEKEYSNLFSKREMVRDLLRERLELRKEMNIKEKDLLLPIYELVSEQAQEIEKEKSNTDNINVLTERIKLKENRLEELNKEVKKPEVLSLLKEFKMIDTYDHDDEELKNEYLFEDEEETNEDKEINEEVNDEEIKNDILSDLLQDEEVNEEEEINEVNDTELEEVFLPNQIKTSEKIMSMNFGLSRLKSISVMKRVADMLGIDTKKDTSKKVSEEVINNDTTIDSDVNTNKNNTIDNSNLNNDLFWTKAEIEDMKEVHEDVKEEVKTEVHEELPNLTDSVVSNDIKQDNVFENNNNIFENNMNTTNSVSQDIFGNKQNIFENNSNQNIFDTNNSNNIFESNNNIVFPDMGTISDKKLPVDNDSDKFKWPENSNLEKFDLNGIFPN